MRDTKQENKDFEAVMDVVKNLNKVDNNSKDKLRDGVYGMLYICIPSLTISTILWQWLG